MNPYFNYPMIISSFKMSGYCEKAYPNRNIIPDMHIAHDEFYYWSRTGAQRMVRNKNQIWTNDHESGWPFIKRIR